MKMLKRFVAKKNERGLLYSEGDFFAVLEPGTYHRFDPYDRPSLGNFSLNTPQFEHRLVGYLRQSEPQLVERYLTRMDLGNNEVGLRYEDGVLVELLAPDSRRLYWEGQTKQRLGRIDLTRNYRLSAALVAQSHQSNLRDRTLTSLDAVPLVQIPASQVGVLKVDDALVGLLQAGQYGFWRYSRQANVELVDIHIQALEVNGQEILTRDEVNLRLNLAVDWRYNDVLTAFSRLNKPLGYLYRELQFGLRTTVGTRILDELLENKQSIDEAVSTHLTAKLEDGGLEVSGLSVRDIVLSDGMKTLLAQVMEAEKAAQTNIIRRRKKTSATHSLLNIAKVMEENPTVLRLEGLETLERAAEHIDRVSVFSGLDQVLSELITLKQT